VRSARHILLTTTLAAGLAGCGGDDADDQGKPSGLPRASHPLSQAIEQWERAAAGGDCPTMRPLEHSRERPSGVPPGAPATAEECRRTAALYREYRGFNATNSREFGTGAVVDGTIGGRNVSTVWALDADGRWHIHSPALFLPTQADPDVRQVGTQAPEGRQFRQRAEEYIQALRRGDCRASWKSLNPGSPFVIASGNSVQDYCRDFTRTLSTRATAFPTLVSRGQAERPRELGATNDFGFFAVKLKDGSVFTLVTGTDPDDLPPAAARGHDADGVINYLRSSPRRRGG
jgi:hypothetical protein